MPHKALVNGELVKSWTYSNEEWQSLCAAQGSGEVEITMSCCPQVRAVLKAGSRRQHFAHKVTPDTCNWKPKSPEHEKIQYLIARACHLAGWEADEEVKGEGYVTDVLAKDDDKSVAFEVQLSYQTLEKTMERRQAFRAANVKDYWLFKKLPATKISKKLYKRLYLLLQEGEEYYIQYPKSRKRLASFVKQVLRNAGQEPVDVVYEPISPGYPYSGNKNVLTSVPDPFIEGLKVFVAIGTTIAIVSGIVRALFPPKKVSRFKKHRGRWRW